MSRAKGIGFGLLAAVLLVVAFGAFVLPGILRSQAEGAVAERFHRRLTLESIHFNPFSLTLTVEGARLFEPDGRTLFASFDRLEAGASLASLWHLAPVLRTLHVVNPSVRIVLEAPHRYNFDDLLHATATPGKPARSLAGFAVHDILVEGGSVLLEDLPRRDTHHITDLRLGIPALSTIPSEAQEGVAPTLSARIDGSEVTFRGQGVPFAVQPRLRVHLDLLQVDLPRYLDYLPTPQPVDITAGRADLHADVDFETRTNEGPTLQVGGHLALQGVQGHFGGAQGWDFHIDEARLEAQQIMLGLAHGDVHWERLALAVPSAQIADRQRPHPLLTHVSALSLEMGAGGTERPVRTDFVATVNALGSVRLQGQTGLAPLIAQWDVDVTHFDLLPFQPILGHSLNLLLTRGEAGLKGRLWLEAGGSGLHAAYQGALSLVDVAAVGRQHARSLLRWKSLRLDGVRLQTAPFSLGIQGVALNDFFVRVVVNPDHQINLQELVRTKESPVQPPPVTIGNWVLQGGVVQFSDHSVNPHYSARLERLGGAVTGLSSDTASTAVVDLRGEVNQAPLRISGQVNPLRGNLFLDIRARMTGMEMAPFSPYSGKYVGYDIEKGKLSFDVSYHVLDHVLSAQNHLVLDQLTFGNQVDSPDAAHLPVQLAIALLKDRNGTIDIHLPVEGFIDDPQFSVGGIVLKMILNLLAKAVTSPFQLLGAFFGEHGAASWVACVPGRADMTPEGQGKLRALSRALVQRPGLKLDIEGHADREADAEALRRVGIEQKVRALWVKAELARGHALTAGAPVPAADYPDLLRQAYDQESFPKPRNFLGLEKSLPVPEMEQLMMANTPVTDENLSGLALQRAQTAEDWLVREGQVPADRLFVVRGRGTGAVPVGAPPDRVQFILK